MSNAGKSAVPRRIFWALADETRCAILEGLLIQNFQSASTLAGPLQISRQAVSKHLDVLAEAGLLRRSREGKKVVFEILPEGLAPASEYIRMFAPHEANTT